MRTSYLPAADALITLVDILPLTIIITPAMPAKRTLTLPPPNISPRNSLPSDDHTVVDAVLKELKQCTRRLQTACEMLHIELQVLEKLYYKGNNQHRTALFWRRVSDIRRFGRRLESADVYGLVEGVRLSFWGSEAKRK